MKSRKKRLSLKRFMLKMKAFFERLKRIGSFYPTTKTLFLASILFLSAIGEPLPLTTVTDIPIQVKTNSIEIESPFVKEALRRIEAEPIVSHALSNANEAFIKSFSLNIGLSNELSKNQSVSKLVADALKSDLSIAQKANFLVGLLSALGGILLGFLAHIFIK